MLIHTYVKTAIRSLLRQRLYAGLNTIGLLVGLASCIIVGLYVHHEITYDQFLPDADRLHVFSKTARMNTMTISMSLVEPRVSLREIESLAKETFESLYLVRDVFKVQVFTAKVQSVEQDAKVVSANFLQGFQFVLLQGDRATCLNAPNKVVLTQDIAEKYFGAEESALGKTLRIKARFDSVARDYIVSAIAENVPSNSSLRFGILLPMEPNNTDHYMTMYGLLRQGKTTADIRASEQALTRYVAEHGVSVQGAKDTKVGTRPFTDEYIRVGQHDEPTIEIASWWKRLQQGNRVLVRIVVVIGLALIMLGVACINYINLQTARALTRAQEMGVRKVLGAYRRHLVAQFFTETCLLVVIAFIGAGVLTELCLPMINTRLNITLHLYQLFSLKGCMVVGASIVLISTLCGVYPALYISRFSTAHILRGHGTQSRENAWLRKTLVVVQFTASIALMISMTVMQEQLSYMKNKSLGFEKDQVVYMDFTDSFLREKPDVLRNALQQVAGVQNISLSDATLMGDVGMLLTPNAENPNMSDEFFTVLTDNNFGATMNVGLIEGRWFANTPADSASCLVNEALVRQKQWDNPLGKKVAGATVIGVVADFHFQSMKETIKPLAVMRGRAGNFNFAMMRLSPNTTFESVDQLYRTVRQLAPNTSFSISFMNEKLNVLYQNERIMADIVNVLGTMTLVVACLGLLGLTAFTVERKTKEISIRKILGATKANILLLLSRDFLVLVGIAIVVAVPIAWYGMEHWLRDYNYRITLQPMVFVGVGCMAIAVALLTIALQAMKTISANPADTLRSE